jgi:hypothetical protein
MQDEKSEEKPVEEKTEEKPAATGNAVEEELRKTVTAREKRIAELQVGRAVHELMSDQEAKCLTAGLDLGPLPAGFGRYREREAEVKEGSRECFVFCYSKVRQGLVRDR